MPPFDVTADCHFVAVCDCGSLRDGSGATAVFKVFLTSLNGFRGLVVLGFPPGDAKWEPGDSIFLEPGATQSTTLLIKTEKGAEEKLYRLLFVAASENVHHESTGSITVVKTPSDDEDDDGDEDDDDDDDEGR